MALFAPDVLEQHELGDDVAVARRRLGGDRAVFLQRFAYAVERFVSQLVR